MTADLIKIGSVFFRCAISTSTRRHLKVFIGSGAMEGNHDLEDKIAIGVLRIAASQTKGEATTVLLKDEMPKFVALSAEELAQSSVLTREPLYKKIVTEIVCSQRHLPGNIIYEGRAQYLGNRSGVRITDAGRAALISLGYAAAAPLDQAAGKN